MKKAKIYALTAVMAITAIVMSSCGISSDVEYDKALMVGKWEEPSRLYEDVDTGEKLQGYNYEVYKADGTGYTWDTADDVTEAEAQKFTWTLEGDDLTQIHIMEMGASVPKVYTVTNLTETELSYKDEYGKTHSFTKVN